MANYPIRRAQLIAPFGVGAMVVVRNGVSLICAGLDNWYKREGEDPTEPADLTKINPDEYKVGEWRLQQLLGVDHFRLPPDYRNTRPDEDPRNTRLTVPFLRFPQWHVCPVCKRLEVVTLVNRSQVQCSECAAKQKRRFLVQVPFIAMCDRGHLQDFPWREWVHASVTPSCKRPMRLVATGGASLADQRVECECGAKRSLSGITWADPSGEKTELSDTLQDGVPYMCAGRRPWLGEGVEDTGEGCGRPIRGSLRSASNVYFADVRSAIYLPRGTAAAPSDLVSLFENLPLRAIVQLYKSSGTRPDVATLRAMQGELLKLYPDQAVASAIDIVWDGGSGASTGGEESGTEEDAEVAFRREEFEVLRTPRQDAQLLIRSSDFTAYSPWLQQFFSRVMLISKLRETRALTGFSRIFPENGLTPLERRRLLRLGELPAKEMWLPAYVVYGEGIFLELQEEKLRAWLDSEAVQTRVEPLLQQYERLQAARRTRPVPLGARYVLLHTLAHVVMNRLTFECGYSSASLRERLYVSDDEHAPMAGVLIYTAAGDAEGTMGGLVRMGRPGNLEPVIQQAIQNAEWCSADPVCMELGARGGQGPDSCNLAACHGCALVPETACEAFNHFLDRGLLIGTLESPDLGYFSQKITLPVGTVARGRQRYA